jgi:hypothetical protein
MSWTLYEAVSFDDTRITSIDWQTYPILRFNSVPDSVAVHIHQPARKTLPRQRRNRAGPGRGLDCQCDRQRHGKTVAPPAADAEENQGRDRRVKAAPFSVPILWLFRKDSQPAAGSALRPSIPLSRSARRCSRRAQCSTAPM